MSKTLYAMIALEVYADTSIEDLEQNAEFSLTHDAIIDADWFDTFPLKAKGEHV